MRSLGILITLATLMAFGAGCGYTLQTSKSPLTEKEGIRKIFVAPLVNNTYRPGVENTIYNALIQTISVHRRVVLVSRPEDADAILRGSVSTADFGPSATTTASLLNPTPSIIGSFDKFSNVLVATEYVASLVCNFNLTRPNPLPGQRGLVWGSSFARSKPFAASNQLGTYGDTSDLINESEFERALGDLARAMMGDVHESMLATF